MVPFHRSKIVAKSSVSVLPVNTFAFEPHTAKQPPPTWALALASLLSSLQFRRTTIDSVDLMDESLDNYGLSGPGGHFRQTTQIYEGTNQVQRVVVAKHLLK